MSEMVGSFTVTIRVRLNADVTKEQAHEFVNEMVWLNYTLTDKVSIADTEVVDNSIDDEDDTRRWWINESRKTS